MSPEAGSIDALKARIGAEIGVSRWLIVDQARIDAFADVTEDDQFIHTDPERAALETEFGGTIAHGFLSVSLLSAMLSEVQPEVKGRHMTVNYGFDRLRFLSPVRAGSQVRGRFILKDVDERKPAEITVTYSVAVEIKNAERPALVADWITRFYLNESEAP